MNERPGSRLDSNKDFLIAKFERNMERDRDVNNRLHELGFVVIRFWGTDVTKNVSGCADIIEQAISERMNHPS